MQRHIVVSYNICGGGEIFAKNTWASRFSKNEVEFLLLRPNPLLQDMLQKDGYKYINIQSATHLFEYIKINCTDITFYNSKNTYQLLDQIKKIKPFHLTEIIHSTLTWPDSSLNISRPAVDKTICVCHSVARELGITNYEVLYPTINEAKFKNEPKIKDPSSIIIGMVSRLSPEKNIGKAIQILSELPSNYKLRIIGSDGGEKNHLKGMCRSLNVESRVEFKDFTNSIEKEFAQFDIFLMTSKVEGFPIVLLESLASDLPTFAPNVGGIAELKEVKLIDTNKTAKELAEQIRQISIKKQALVIEQKRDIKIEKKVEVIKKERDLDFLFISGMDETTTFHNCGILTEMLKLVNKKAETTIVGVDPKTRLFTFDNYKISKLLERTKNVVFYRFPSIPQDIKNYCKINKIPIGFTIDDNVWELERDFPIPMNYRDSIKKAIVEADYCFAGAEELVKEIEVLNKKSFHLKGWGAWSDLYRQVGVIEHKLNDSETIRIGVTSGMAHLSDLNNKIDYFIEQLKGSDKKIEIVCFTGKQEVKIVNDKLKIECHPFTSGWKNWYNKLHSLKLDCILIELNNKKIIRSKSDLKYREASLMEIPLIVIDPTSIVYKCIENGKNGWTFKNKESFGKEILSILDKDKLKKNGLEAHKEYNSRNPKESIERFLENKLKILTI